MGLIEDAAAARAAGMTYGQYMAGKPVKPYVKDTKRRCINCGAELSGMQMKYCGLKCRERMRYKNVSDSVYVQY